MSKTAEDGRNHKKTVEDNRIYKFLAGLNVEFDDVRSRILGRRPLLSISEVFSEVRREKSRRNVMLGKKGTGVVAEGSALVATCRGFTNQLKLDENPFCNKPRHTCETY